MARLKYCLFSGAEAVESDKKLVMGGLYAWVEAFQKYGNGGSQSANTARDLLEEFDVVHVNYTPGNASYIAALRDSLGDHSDTKIVTQVDFSAGMWNTIDPFVMRQQLSLADFVFHVEPVGAKMLGHYLGREIPVIPHPVDVDGVSKYRKNPKLPPIVTCQYHRYMHTWHPYFYATYRFRRDPAFNIRVLLMNHTEGGYPVPLDSMFDEIVGRCPYPLYIDMLSHSLVNLDITPDFTYGRGIVEAAALGVPTVGSVTVRAMNYIWPELACFPYDSPQMDRVLECLFTDQEFSTEMVKQGIERSKFYNLESSYNRLVCAMIDGGVV